jgi:hypothetical protein
MVATAIKGIIVSEYNSNFSAVLATPSNQLRFGFLTDFGFPQELLQNSFFVPVFDRKTHWDDV